MTAALTLLLAFQLAAKVLARSLALPLSGPVIGMACLVPALALALSACRSRHLVARAPRPLAAALQAGSLVAVVCAVAIGAAFGLPLATLLSLVPKSATDPVALGISDGIGGTSTLTAVMVILTGIIGAVIAAPLSNLIRLRDWRARDFAFGRATPGIGTARAVQVHPTAGAFASPGMGLECCSDRCPRRADRAPAGRPPCFLRKDHAP